MATERQIAANRRNANRSTGPRSRAGRKRAAGNATVHGLTANLLSSATLAEQVESGRPGLSYTSFLTWRGQLVREPPRRPDPEAPAAPPSYRSEAWKLGFTGSRCTSCGARHLPPNRVCVSCRAVDHMVPERLADVPATVATFTVDRLAYSLSPPVVAAVVDFDGGGRFRCGHRPADERGLVGGASKHLY